MAGEGLAGCLPAIPELESLDRKTYQSQDNIYSVFSGVMDCIVCDSVRPTEWHGPGRLLSVVNKHYEFVGRVMLNGLDVANSPNETLCLTAPCLDP